LIFEYLEEKWDKKGREETPMVLRENLGGIMCNWRKGGEASNKPNSKPGADGVSKVEARPQKGGGGKTRR